MSIHPDQIPPSPAEHAPVSAARESIETLALLAERRSTKTMFLAEPGPTPAQLDTLLRLAARAPDHGKLGPWRFILIEEDGRQRAGDALAAILESDGVAAERLAIERKRFLQAPVAVIVVSSPLASAKVPEWEQVLSAGAVCYGLLIAAHAMGFAGTWLTEWMAYDARGRAALGLADHERIAGIVYLGAAATPAAERLRADYAARVTKF